MISAGAGTAPAKTRKVDRAKQRYRTFDGGKNVLAAPPISMKILAG
jgi:hypothetical protein